jgi:hypothetical protein
MSDRTGNGIQMWLVCDSFHDTQSAYYETEVLKLIHFLRYLEEVRAYEELSVSIRPHVSFLKLLK